ncbi:MAG: MFS transporter [Bacteroidetes bacterium]|nr:MFS transporter [Bacteroidota bacterium]
MNQPKQPTNSGALATLVIVFFFWGFIAASNSIFIPFCRTHFNLDQFQSQLIGSAFYVAYFVGSLILYLSSSFLGYDILNKIGYKKGIIYGLGISVVGALAIIPSANANSFPLILVSFFIIALGFSLQQTAAQPFAIALGDPATGSHRLNLAGGVNSLGTTLGPIIVSFFLFGTPSSANANVTVTNVNNLYMIVAAVFAAVALFFAFSKLPDGKDDAKFEASSKASYSLIAILVFMILIIIIGQFTALEKLPLLVITLIGIFGILFYSYSSASKNSEGWGAMKYQQLILGMIGIFLYVGAEVTIDNNFGALLKSPGYMTESGLHDSQISQYVSLYWGSLMIGRWTGAIGVFNFSEKMRKVATVVVPFIAFGVVLFVNHLYGNPIADLLPYSIVIIIAIAAFFFGQQKPVKTLLTLALLACFAMLFGVATKGIVSVYAIMSGGICCSIMWPCIFSLAIAGLGKYTSQGSAFLIMMILGGAIIPPFQGSIGDKLNMHVSYLVAAACFASLAFLAIRLRTVLKSQGLNFDEQIGGGH